MAQAKTYRLPPFYRWGFGLGGAFFLFVAGGILFQILRGQVPREGTIFYFVWLIGFFAAFVYTGYSQFIAIKIANDTITFRSLFRTVELSVSSIRSIEVDRWSPYAPLFRHDRGKLRLLLPVEGMHDLLTRLKEKNPSIEISPRM
jgi:hypothetical protein